MGLHALHIQIHGVHFDLLLIFCAGSLKQQSVGRHVSKLVHFILIPSEPVFALSLRCCLLSGEATNTYFIVFGMI